MSAMIPDEGKKISEELSSFLESLKKERCEEELIDLIKNIGIERYTAAVKIFLELDEEKKKKLGLVLSKAISSEKILKNSQVISFFKDLFNDPTFTITIGKPCINELDGPESTDFETFHNTLLREYLNQLVESGRSFTFDDIKVFNDITVSTGSRFGFRRREFSEFIGDYYKSQDMQAQEKFLSVFLKGLSDAEAEDEQTVYTLKCIEPEIFQKVFDRMTPKGQYCINNILYESSCEIVFYIKQSQIKDESEDWSKKAIEEFIQHPNSLKELSKSLKSNSLSIDEIEKFLFDKLLELQYPKRFSIIRVCFENEKNLKEYSEIFKRMLEKYMIAGLVYGNREEVCRALFLKPSWYKHIAKIYEKKLSPEQQEALLGGLLDVQKEQLNHSLIKLLCSSNPKLFEKVLNQKDPLAQERMRVLLEASTEEQKTTYEQTIIEEIEMVRFKELLGIPDKFSLAFAKIDIATDRIEETQNKHSDFPKILISLYFKKAIELNKIDKIDFKLFSYLEFGSHALKAYSELRKEDQKKLISMLLKQYGSRFNAILIQGLCDSATDVFKEGLDSIKDKNLTETIEKLLTVPPRAKSSISEVMQHFASDERGIPFRRLTGHTAQLVCAEIDKRKSSRPESPYDFNPTVLYHKDFRKYIDFFVGDVNKTGQSVKERFVLTGDHWVAGELRISKDRGGKPKIELFIIDSLGEDEPKTLEIIRRECLGLRNQYATTLYLSGEKRQHSGVGCGVFALRDVQELFTIENEDYLPENEKNLFKYLEKNKLKTKYNLPLGSLSKLPLRFMRLEQSSNLITVTIPGRMKIERSAPVNKKKQNIEESIKQHLKEVDGKKRNERAVYIANKIAERIFSYLCKNNFDLVKIESEMFPFSFEGRKKLYAQRQSPKQVEEKECKEKQEVYAGKNKPLMFTEFQTFKESTRNPDEMESKDVKERMEQDIYDIRNLLQNKFKYKVADLGALVKYLCERYTNGSIETVDQLKEHMKQYLQSSNTYEELSGTQSYEGSCIDAADNEPFLKQILETLPSLTRRGPKLAKGLKPLTHEYDILRDSVPEKCTSILVELFSSIQEKRMQVSKLCKPEESLEPDVPVLIFSTSGLRTIPTKQETLDVLPSNYKIKYSLTIEYPYAIKQKK